MAPVPYRAAWLMDAHPDSVRDGPQAAEIARLSHRIVTLEEEVQGLTAAQARRAVEDRRLRAASAQRAAEARKEAEAMRARTGVAEAPLAAFRAERERLLADISLARQERDSLLASTSWRVTGPLRWAAAFIRRRLRQPAE